MLFYFAGSVLLSYLIGSIPFGLLLARLKGVDIRKVGSGNIGATNVFRSVGKGIGLFTFFCDFLKGCLPVFLLPIIMNHLTSYADPYRALALSCGVAAIAGHNWSIFMHFTGGKGVATGAGFLLALVPAAVGVGFLGWVALLLITGYVSVASMGAAILVACFSWYRYATNAGDYPLAVVCILTILVSLVVARHHTNIKRLLNGTENRFSPFKKKKTS